MNLKQIAGQKRIILGAYTQAPLDYINQPNGNDFIKNFERYFDTMVVGHFGVTIGQISEGEFKFQERELV